LADASPKSQRSAFFARCGAAAAVYGVRHTASVPPQECRAGDVEAQALLLSRQPAEALCYLLPAAYYYLRFYGAARCARRVALRPAMFS